MDSRRRRGKLQYKVKWVNDEELTLQPEEDLENAQDAVILFHQQYPKKPAP